MCYLYYFKETKRGRTETTAIHLKMLKLAYHREIKANTTRQTREQTTKAVRKHRTKTVIKTATRLH